MDSLLVLTVVVLLHPFVMCVFLIVLCLIVMNTEPTNVIGYRAAEYSTHAEQ